MDKPWPSGRGVERLTFPEKNYIRGWPVKIGNSKDPKRRRRT
jgi:hypothetical protein